jgi:VIT1/CCC1 family predicted Fe2+/Mn2+ transporter
VFFLIIIAILLALIAFENPQRSGIGMVVVALGIPVYHFLFRPSRLHPLPIKPSLDS